MHLTTEFPSVYVVVFLPFSVLRRVIVVRFVDDHSLNFLFIVFYIYSSAVSNRKCGVLFVYSLLKHIVLSKNDNYSFRKRKNAYIMKMPFSWIDL